MAHRRWTLKLADGVHVVELDHRWFSGRRRILLDGQPVLESGPRTFDDGGSHHELSLARPGGGVHDVEVHIRTNGLWFTYKLFLDGEEIAPDRWPAGMEGRRLPATGSGAVAVSSTMEPAKPAREVKRKDRFISFDGWFRGER